MASSISDTDFELQSWFREALKNALNRKRSISAAAMYDKFDHAPLHKRVNLSKDKEDYVNLTFRFEAAVKDVLNGKEVSLVAAQYSLDLETLREEIHQYTHSAVEPYEYNGTRRIFTIKEELLLLKILATIPRSRCLCQTCTVERLPALAYQMALQKCLTYPTEWDKHQKAGKGWLVNFQIDYSYEIENSFPAKCIVLQ